MTVRVEVVPAGEWADLIAAELAARIRDRPNLRLCLPTGDSPAPVYQRLVELSRAGAVSFADVTIVGLDEFLALTPGDPARCADRLRRELLDGLEPPPAAVHLIDPDTADPGAEAARHDAVAAAGLDFVLLGLGMNGHVGLNEPGSRATSPTRVVEVARATQDAALERYRARAKPSRGITLGMDRLLAASEVWLLVTGERKAGILRRTVEGPDDGEVPATLLRNHPRLRVIADEPAAAELEPGSVRSWPR